MEDGTGYLAEALVLAMLGVLGMVVIPFALLFTYGGASNPQNITKFVLYAATGGILLVVVEINLLARYFNLYEQYPELEGFKFMTFHTPGDSFFGKRTEILRNPFSLASISLLLALLIGFGASVSGSFGTGLPGLVEGSFGGGQGTATQEVAVLGLAVEPAVMSETLLINVFLLEFTAGLLYFFLYLQNTNRWIAFGIAKAVGVVVATIGGYAYHAFRYGADAANQLSVLALMFITNVVTAVTNSAIPAYLIHAVQNFFHAASQYQIFSVEGAAIAAGFGVILSAGLFYVSGVRRLVNFEGGKR